MLNFNFDEVEETSYINQEGTYTVKVNSFKVKTLPDERIIHEFYFKTQDGAMIKHGFFMTKKAIFFYKKFIKALGHEAKGELDVDALSPKLIDKKLIITVKRQDPKRNDFGQLEESKFFNITDFESIKND